jgi:hypothetical protein
LQTPVVHCVNKLRWRSTFALNSQDDFASSTAAFSCLVHKAFTCAWGDNDNLTELRTHVTYDRTFTLQTRQLNLSSAACCGRGTSVTIHAEARKSLSRHSESQSYSLGPAHCSCLLSSDNRDVCAIRCHGGCASPEALVWFWLLQTCPVSMVVRYMLPLWVMLKAYILLWSGLVPAGSLPCRRFPCIRVDLKLGNLSVLLQHDLVRREQAYSSDLWDIDVGLFICRLRVRDFARCWRRCVEWLL